MSIDDFIERRVADAVVPGSGEALGIVQRLKPLLPYLIGLVAILAAAGMIYWAPWAQARGRAASVAKYQPVMDRATRRMAHAMAALKDADDAIRWQNASIRALATEERKRLTEADRLLAEADNRDVSRKAVIAKLNAAAAKPLPGPPCDAPQELKDAWQ